MYLLIGHPTDLCCQQVQTCLQSRGHEVLTTSEPLTSDATFAWHLTTTTSTSRLRHARHRARFDDTSWSGVLVRAQGAPTDADNWSNADLVYAQAEAQAALLAWLHSLPCPVVNRLSADLWYRAQRPFPEWQVLLAHCGLPTPALLITNAIGAARRFAEPWNGSAMYAPLTSTTRYPIASEAQWNELERLMVHFPVTLVEPVAGAPFYATVVGHQTIWHSEDAECPANQAQLERGLAALAHMLQIDFLQAQFETGAEGPVCTDVQIYPRFAVHTAAEQATIAEGIATLLEANYIQKELV